MNTSLTAYTHLESLLLFQSLHAYGLGPHVFSRISELLKSNPHITADKRFQSGRLSPDALRNFYLHILKEEIRSEQALADGDAPNGDIKSSRKRKAPSPSLPTVQESVQHQHLIPKLVNKLYARYRAAVTEQVRQDEERYDRLRSELQGIERGEWDSQLKEKPDAKSVSRSPSLPRKSPLLPQQPLPSKASPRLAASESARVEPPAKLVPERRLESVSVPGPTTIKQDVSAELSKVPSSQNGETHVDGYAKTDASPRKKPALPDQPVPSPTSQPHQAPSVLQHQNRAPQPIAPLRPQAQQPTGPAFNAASYPPPLPFAQNVLPTGSPQTPSQTRTPHPLATSSPATPFQSQPQHPFAGNRGPQYGPVSGALPPQFSPTHQHFPASHPPGPQSPNVHNPQQQRNYLPYHGQPPFPPQQQMGQPPPQGGFMLPPFQVSPQDPSRAHQPPAQASAYSQVSTPVTNRHSSAKVTPQLLSTGRKDMPSMHPLLTQARHSFSTPSGMRTPQSTASTPRSAKTIWKASASFETPVAPRPEVSPIDDVVATEQPQQSPPKAKSSRKPRAKKAKEKEAEKEPEPESQQEHEQPPEDTAPELETRRGRSRRKAPLKRTRLGSIASSQAGTSVRERSRSRSIFSHTETVAADNDSQAGGRIKSERGNSTDIVDEDAPTPSQMSTRRRGGPLQTLQPSHKRKRNAREVSLEPAEEQPSILELPKTVIAPRHFSRMCTPLMNDIGSHKHASTFTTAVKPKDAEGYYDIIRRPTDLKSIQKAIAAGAKQVAAAASGDTPVGSPGGGGGVVELPLTVDNIPPKAIVNSAQLEKELMRMFVNAVMFNTGEEGVVEDAREMFETVQQSVSSWRSVERASGRLEVEETPPVQDDDAPTASKRRKL